MALWRRKALLHSPFYWLTSRPITRAVALYCGLKFPIKVSLNLTQPNLASLALELLEEMLP